MKIRDLLFGDEPMLRHIHETNQLPPDCFPDFRSKLAIGGLCVVDEFDIPVIACALIATSELYLLVDHQYGTPAERWQMLMELRDNMVEYAKSRGLKQMTAWIPPEIEVSFADRLKEMGFVRSPWSSYTLNLI